MVFSKASAAERRANFRSALSRSKILQFPGSFSPLSSLLIEDQGFDGVYISGAVLSADLGLPDVGLTTQTEVIHRGGLIARATRKLPSLIDIDTGFGEPMNVARTISELEQAGIAGCHLEDQVNPKRCGHLDNKTLVDTAEMVKKIKAAVSARLDSNFIICARTDARGPEGFDSAVERAKAYLDAGADMIFPEALTSLSEFEQFKKKTGALILANMTEFGKSDLFTAKELEGVGANVVIYPVTLLRSAMGAAERVLTEIKSTGTQRKSVAEMQTRKRLYQLLSYDKYTEFDQTVFNFSQSNFE